jgi:hypothetical protein
MMWRFEFAIVAVLSWRNGMWIIMAQVVTDPRSAEWWAQFGVLGVIVFFVGLAVIAIAWALRSVCIAVWDRLFCDEKGYVTRLVKQHEETSKRQLSINEQQLACNQKTAGAVDNLAAAVDASHSQDRKTHRVLDHLSAAAARVVTDPKALEYIQRAQDALRDD